MCHIALWRGEVSVSAHVAVMDSAGAADAHNVQREEVAEHSSKEIRNGGDTHPRNGEQRGRSDATTAADPAGGARSGMNDAAAGKKTSPDKGNARENSTEYPDEYCFSLEDDVDSLEQEFEEFYSYVETPLAADACAAWLEWCAKHHISPEGSTAASMYSVVCGS